MNRRLKKDIVKELRDSKLLTQVQLAEQLGVSLKTIQRCEKGENVSSFVINQIVEFFKVEINSILESDISSLSPKKVQFDMILNGRDLHNLVKNRPFIDCECDESLSNSSRLMASKVIDLFGIGVSSVDDSSLEQKWCEDLVYGLLLQDIGTFVYTEDVYVEGERFLLLCIRFTTRYNTAVDQDGKLNHYI